jgi:urease accessory protein
MDRDSKLMRGEGPTIFASVKNNDGVEAVVDLILAAWKAAGAPGNAGAVGDMEDSS